MNFESMRGRRLLTRELPVELQSQKEKLQNMAAMEIKEETVFCQRCGSLHIKDTVRIYQEMGKQAGEFFYCPTCIQLGRVDSRQRLYYLNDEQACPPQKEPHQLTWEGKLTKSQQEISDKLVCTINQQENLLVWAVTGAGKTEMMFAGILFALQGNKRICIASPRVDVCLELYPRLQQAFSNTEIALLHGSQEEAYRYTPLVVATTHQLLRFYKAFDVLIIDEVDAFPFVNNEMLAYGVKNAQKGEASLIYLTATPTKALFAEMKHQKLPYEMLPARYHGYPLVMPRYCFLWNWQVKLYKGKLHSRLLKMIQGQLQNHKATMLFCPNIQVMRKITDLLQRKFIKQEITCVFAADPQRKEKVQAFRDGKIDILLTTTILERGVTIYGVDVFVLEANHRVFTSSALVQIAGRAGRSSDQPTGLVCFFHSGQSKAMKQASKEILKMNQLAQKKGYLKS